MKAPVGEVGPAEVASRHVDRHVDLARAVKVTYISEGPREHPVSQGVDELRRFDERQEALGCEEPVHGVLPADECLDGIEAAVRESRLWAEALRKSQSLLLRDAVAAIFRGVDAKALPWIDRRFARLPMLIETEKEPASDRAGKIRCDPNDEMNLTTLRGLLRRRA